MIYFITIIIQDRMMVIIDIHKMCNVGVDRNMYKTRKSIK